MTASWLPPGLPAEALDGAWHEERRVARQLGVTVRSFRPTPGDLARLGDHLRAAARRTLKQWAIADLADLFERLAQRWSDVDDPVRIEAIPAIAAATGFSPEMVAHAIDLEQESSRAEHLLRALRQELGDPEALDGLVPNPMLMGRSRVVGPELVGAVYSANIPGLPHLEVMRAFLVKAACLGKVARGEPVFLAAYARTLAEEAPELADCLAVVSLDRDDEAGRRALAGAVDHLVAYGGTDAMTAWRAVTPPTLPATWHGHRLGLAVVLREALTADGLADLSAALAYDSSVFDQEACLAPAAVYAERGGAVSPAELAAAIAHRMEDEARRLPPRELSVHDRATLRGWLDDRRLDGARVVAARSGLPWVVVLDDDAALAPTPPGRVVRVVAVDDAAMVPPGLRPLRHHLQCAAVAGVAGDRLDAVSDALAVAGVSRLCRPGLMGLPSMMWRHDGTACLAGLVRFVDEEVLAPRDNLWMAR